MTPPAAESPLVLTLDIGTSSVRALLFDRGARHLDGLEARRQHGVRTTPDGGAELDPLALLREVEEVVDEILSRAGPRAAQIRAVACCTFWHSVLAVDGQGAPVTPVYTWGDTRAAGKGDELRKRLDERAYHARTGAFFHPLFLPPKLLWFPTEARRQRLLSFGEFLYSRLFGRTLCTVSMASGTGLLDINACDWDPEILQAVGIAREQLSPLGDVKDAFTGLRDPYGQRWSALKDVPWTPPVGDGACNNLGSGCATPERIAVMVGTSGAMRVVSETPRIEIPWGLWCYRADRRRVVLGGALNDGGNLLDWCRRTLNLGAPEEVERELAAMEPDRHGLTFLPFLAGERSPGWVAHARGAVTGLRLDTKPVQILRAALEAVALRFELIRGLICGSFPQAREIVASGGALRESPAWTQMMADAMGRPILPAAEPEASARGAALLTLEALGMIPRLQDLPSSFGAAISPD
ncbi:MAG TPA: gluconokinase, partial [Planctomycetota bacterium]|nr:gluconokinase [Planctomycetota bacterium]